MPISTTRIVELTGTAFKLIAQPVRINFEHNPETGTAGLRFEFIQMLDVDGVTRNVNFGRLGHVSRNWTDIETSQPAYAGALDPVTGADLTQVSMRGVLMILMDAFDRGYAQDNTAP